MGPEQRLKWAVAAFAQDDPRPGFGRKRLDPHIEGSRVSLEAELRVRSRDGGERLKLERGVDAKEEALVLVGKGLHDLETAITGIRADDIDLKATSACALIEIEKDLWLVAMLSELCGNSRRSESLRILTPGLRQVELAINKRVMLALRIGDKDDALAGIDLADATGVLAFSANGVGALARVAGVISDKDARKPGTRRSVDEWDES